MKRPSVRTGWLAAAAGLLLAGSAAIVVGAADSGSGTVLVPVVPERVVDTRQAGAQFGTLGARDQETISFAAFVPADARAVQLNVTAVRGTTTSYLTLWPTGVTRPVASSVNWNSRAASPNSVTVKLGTGRSVEVYNDAGSVDVIVDLVGYYLDAPEGGPPGPEGPKGDTGATGAPGAPGISGIETRTATANFVGGVVSTVTATCSVGKTVISGGFEISEDISRFDSNRVATGPSGTTGWSFTGTSGAVTPADDQNVTVFAVCATVAP